MKVYTIEGMGSIPGAEVTNMEGSAVIKIGDRSRTHGYENYVRAVSSSKVINHVTLEKDMFETKIVEDYSQVEDETQVLLVIKDTPRSFETIYHTGDRELTYCGFCSKSLRISIFTCPDCSRETKAIYKPLPLNIIASDPVSSFGFHFIGVLPKLKILRIGTSITNDNNSMYFLFDGRTLLSATWRERMRTQIF